MDINILLLFFFVALFIYILALLILAFFPLSPAERAGEIPPPLMPVTLLIPFRNEQENLPELLASIGHLSYPYLEVIFIDDHSEDGGADLLKKVILMEGLSNVKVELSPKVGKKAAIEHGLLLGNGKLILTTDADCSFQPDWVQHMIAPFRDPMIQMVCGPVMITSKDDNFNYFQQIEWSSVLLVTRFFFRINRPIMCSAANMAYRKETFQHLEGYRGNESSLSGDDVFLLEKMCRSFGPESIRYNIQKEAVVWTKGANSWHGLLQQRIRWASKWNQHQQNPNLLTALLSFGWALVCGGSFLLPVLSTAWLVPVLAFWMVKLGIELLVLRRVLKLYEIKLPWTAYVFTGVIHPFYVLVVGVGGWRGKFTWKGRESGVNS